MLPLRNLRTYYYSSNETYEDIAIKIGVSKSTIYYWIEGGITPNKKNQYRIKRFLEEQESQKESSHVS